jgi:hypothetical protein
MKKIISKEYFVCEECKEIITDHIQSIIVKGNICIANYKDNTAKIGAGIVGRNHEPYTNFEDCMETSFHSLCFVKSVMKSMDLSKYDLD